MSNTIFDDAKKEKKKLAIVFTSLLGIALAFIIYMQGHGFISSWWLFGVLIGLYVVGYVYRKSIKVWDILIFGLSSFLLVHILMFSFFTHELSKESLATFTSYPDTKEALMYPKYKDDGVLIDDGIWQENEFGQHIPANKEMWCAKNKTGRQVLKSEGLKSQGNYRKTIPALLSQAHLSTAWVHGCMSDEDFLNKHHEFARIAWEVDPHFDWRKMDYTPFYQVLEVSDYIVAPRLFMRASKLCPVLIHRVFPELRGRQDDPSLVYCASHFESKNEFEEQYSYTLNYWRLAFGLDRKNMDQAKKEILAHKAMTTDDIKDIKRQIKNDKEIIFGLLEEK